MLGKCANPVCRALFRKLGSGKLFAFESVTSAKSADTHRTQVTSKRVGAQCSSGFATAVVRLLHLDPMPEAN
jgi:hypothetical protein